MKLVSELCFFPTHERQSSSGGLVMLRCVPMQSTECKVGSIRSRLPGTQPSFCLPCCSPLGGKDCVDAGNRGRIGGQQDRVADDVEWQLPWLSAEQLGFQEGGPLLLQQLFTAHVILGERMESRPCCECTRPTHLIPIPIGFQAARPPQGVGGEAAWGMGADLADLSHSGYVQLLKEVKLAGCLLKEEIDDLGGWNGCHEGGVRCGGQDRQVQGTEHRDAQGSLGDTVGWIPRARAEVVSHPMAC